MHLDILIHQGPPVTQSVVFGVHDKDTQDTITELQQNLDEMNQCKKTDHKKYEWAATGPGVRIKL